MLKKRAPETGTE